MDISAERLYRNSNLRQIQDIIDDIYKSITYKVHEAHQSGLSEVMFDLPDTLAAGNLEPADVQLAVYSRLIEMVKQQGLRVRLRRTENGGSMLRIAWPSMLDPVEKKRMKDIIKEHLEI